MNEANIIKASPAHFDNFVEQQAAYKFLEEELKKKESTLIGTNDNLVKNITSEMSPRESIHRKKSKRFKELKEL